MKKLLFDTPEEAIQSEDTVVVYCDMVQEVGLHAAMIYSTMDWHGSPDLKNLEGILGKKVIKSNIRKLEKLGILPKNIHSPQEIAEILKNKPTEGVGRHVCEWCSRKTLLLHEHHFPISKLKGGTETVRICGTCHYEYHHLQKKGWSLEISDGPYGELTAETESGPDNPARCRENG